MYVVRCLWNWQAVRRSWSLGRGVGWSCRFGDDQDYAVAATMRWMKAPMGTPWKKKGKEEVNEERENVVTEARRVKSFTNEYMNRLLNMAERSWKKWERSFDLVIIEPLSRDHRRSLFRRTVGTKARWRGLWSKRHGGSEYRQLFRENWMSKEGENLEHSWRRSRIKGEWLSFFS